MRLDLVSVSFLRPARSNRYLRRSSIMPFDGGRPEAKRSFRGMSFTNVVFAVFSASLVTACASVSGGGATAGFASMPLAQQQAVVQEKDSAAAPKSVVDRDAVRKIALNLTAVDPESKSYRVGPRDVLEVTVFQAPELSKTIQVSEAGTINFPLIGEVEASGRSAREIEQELSKRLGAKYLQNPQISVFVKDYFSQRVTLEGAVTKPGVIPIAGGMSLLQAIAQGGGFTDLASHTVVVFRQVGGKRLAAQYDVSAIRDGSAPDLQLEAGDVIVVPTSELKEGMNLILKTMPLVTLVPLL